MATQPHLYNMTCFPIGNKWYVNDVKNLSGRSAKWYTPMRILNLSIEEYIDLLLNTFHAEGFRYYESTDFLFFYFSKEKEAKAFCSYVNKQAKQKNYYCV